MMTFSIIGALAGCADKAKPDYARCVQLSAQGDVRGSWDACNAAVSADPTSIGGKAAAVKLAEMKPKYDVWKIEQDKAAAEAEIAYQRYERDRVVALREKVSWSFDYDDNRCAGEGLPPEGREYGGGTWAEIATVASADGCKNVTHGFYCCPSTNESTARRIMSH